MDPFPRGRAGLFRPRVPQRAPRSIPDEQFSELFARLGSHRDRALVAFWVSTGARASELLGATAADADPGRQLITVIRKGTRAMQQLPASPDAFVWLRLYQEQMRGLVPAGPDQPLWWTLRRPFRQLAYHAALRMFTRAGESLGKGWTLHDLRHTAAYRMARDPEMPLTDIQWILGHARLSTTQVYLTPVPDDVIAAVTAFHARRARPAPPAAAGNRGRLPGGNAAGPVRDDLVSGGAPAGLASSFLFTRVPPGPAAPEGAQVMRQFPPRPRPGRWPGTVLDREQASALLLAPPFRLESRGGQRQRSRMPGAGAGLAGRPARRHVAGTLGGLGRRQAGSGWRETAVGVAHRGGQAPALRPPGPRPGRRAAPADLRGPDPARTRDGCWPAPGCSCSPARWPGPVTRAPSPCSGRHARPGRSAR